MQHTDKTFQTKEFAIQITKLPKVTKDNTTEQMRADLWQHILTVTKDTP
jgi:hypothetical protein